MEPKYKLQFYDTMSTPREDPEACLGRMICRHRRYCFPNELAFDFSQFNSWREVETELKKRYEIILPLYLYDHSGITMATKPFSYPWDSGQVGFIVTNKKTIREHLCVKRATKKILDKAREILEFEVVEYDAFISGDMHEVALTDLDDEGIDECTIIGDEFKTNGLFEMLKAYLTEAEAEAVIAKVSVYVTKPYLIPIPED